MRERNEFELQILTIKRNKTIFKTNGYGLKPLAHWSCVCSTFPKIMVSVNASKSIWDWWIFGWKHVYMKPWVIPSFWYYITVYIKSSSITWLYIFYYNLFCQSKIATFQFIGPSIPASFINSFFSRYISSAHSFYHAHHTRNQH